MLIINHCLTPEKGVLYTDSGTSGSKCIHQNPLLTARAYVHFALKWDWMRTPICGGVHIQSHFNTKCKHAWGNNNRIWCMYLGQEVPEWVYALFWCKTVQCMDIRIQTWCILAYFNLNTCMWISHFKNFRWGCFVINQQCYIWHTGWTNPCQIVRSSFFINLNMKVLPFSTYL